MYERTQNEFLSKEKNVITEKHVIVEHVRVLFLWLDRIRRLTVKLKENLLTVFIFSFCEIPSDMRARQTVENTFL